MGSWEAHGGPAGLLPRTSAAFRTLDVMLRHGVPAIASTKGAELATLLDGSVAALLEAAGRAQAHFTLEALRAEPDSAAVQEAGGRFIATAVDGHHAAKALLGELGAAELLALAVRRHPHAQGVQDHTLWGLLQLQGRAPLISVLQDPELANSPEVVSAALWCLSSDVARRPVEVMPWAERMDLASVAQAALARFPSNPKLATDALNIIGAMLKAQARDAVHADATNAVPCVIRMLQAHGGDSSLQKAAAQSLVNLVEGNSSAASALRSHAHKVVALLDGVMAGSSDKDVLLSLGRVYYCIFGAAGLLEAVSRTALQGPDQQGALLQVLGKYSEEGDVETLFKLDSVTRVLQAMEASGSSAGSVVPASIAALGRIAEFYMQHAMSTSSSAHLVAEVEKVVEAIVRRLQAEITAREPYVLVYAEALEALRNLSCRCDQLGSKISACSTLTSAVDLAFEKDYFSLGFGTLWQLLGAIHFFSGLQRLLTLLEKYQTAPILHEAACGVLVEAAEHEDGASSPGTIIGSAASLAFYATKVLVGMVPGARNSEALAARAVQLQGHVLGFVSPDTLLPAQQGPQDACRDPAGPVLEDGLKSLLGLLRGFPTSARLASEVCCALVRAAAANSAAVVPVLAACHAGDALLEVVRLFWDDATVLADAVVALGALGGASTVLALLSASPQSLPLKQAGCRAFADLCRMGLRFASLEEHAAAEEAIRSARQAFSEQEQWQLLAQAEVTLGLLGQAQLAGTAV